MIELKNVVKKYKKLRALDDVSLEIKEGRITCLLGINGVGKSTMMKAIMGLIPIDSGEILIDGQKISANVYNDLAFIPDINITNVNMTIGEQFEYMSKFYDNWNKDKAEKMLKYFKLTEDKKISELSKGNAARVKVILGFCQNAKYLLMDEPFSGMDMFTREDFVSVMIGEFYEEDQAIIVTTHEIQDVENIAEDVILLEDGKVVKTFSAEDVREESGKSIIDVMREVYRHE